MVLINHIVHKLNINYIIQECKSGKMFSSYNSIFNELFYFSEDALRTEIHDDILQRVSEVQ